MFGCHRTMVAIETSNTHTSSSSACLDSRAAVGKMRGVKLMEIFPLPRTGTDFESEMESHNILTYDICCQPH